MGGETPPRCSCFARFAALRRDLGLTGTGGLYQFCALVDTELLLPLPGADQLPE